MKKYKLLVFDWDGTLQDSTQCIVECVQETSKELGLPTPSEKVICNGIGLVLMDQINALFPEHPERHAEFMHHYLQRYYKHLESINFFEGALETLDYLKKQGYLLAIATSKIRRNLEKALDTVGIRGWFSATGAGDDEFGKPHPGMMLRILEELEINPPEALMIGDSEYDMQLAHNAGVDALAVTYGVHDSSLLRSYKPVACIGDIRELQKLL